MSTDLNAALDEVLGAPAPRPAPARTGPPPVPEPGLVRVAVEDLQVSEANPRQRLSDVADLANSIAENGLIQPIIARRTPTGLVIVAGHRRHNAVQLLGWISVEVIVRRDMAPDAELAAMLVENGQRAGLDPIEEARALSRLKTLGGLSDAQLAKKVGRSQATVSGRLVLLALPADEQEALRAKQTTVQVATHNARVASGRVGKLGVGRAWHFSPDHDLARAAGARCQRLQHRPGRRVGGLACGACWESVIRADERQHLHQLDARTGKCPICGTPTEIVQP